MVYPAASADDYRRRLADLLPPGPVWPRDLDSVLGSLLEGMGADFASTHNDTVGLLSEIIPATTDDLLPDWESVVGLPDECSPLAATGAERRQEVLARLNSLGGSSSEYFESVSATLGFTVTTVTDHPQFRAGLSRVGVDPLVDDDYGLTLTVTADVTGKSSAQISTLQCIMAKLKPQHTKIEFVFTTTATEAWTDGSNWTDAAVGWAN